MMAANMETPATVIIVLLALLAIGSNSLYLSVQSSTYGLLFYAGIAMAIIGGLGLALMILAGLKKEGYAD